MHLLFLVEDAFEIKRRGVVASGPLDDPDARYRIGDSVEIRRENGSVIRTIISGYTTMPLPPRGTAEVLLRDLSRDDVQPGDEVWIGDEHPADSPRDQV